MKQRDIPQVWIELDLGEWQSEHRRFPKGGEQSKGCPWATEQQRQPCRSRKMKSQEAKVMWGMKSHPPPFSPKK